MRRVFRRDRVQSEPATQGDLGSLEDRKIIEQVSQFTMTGALRLQALIDAVRYCANRGVPGAFAECGVWRGGSVLAIIATLQELGLSDRDIYLYDTFEGMTKPTAADVSEQDGVALDEWEAAKSRQERAWDAMFGAEVFDEESVRVRVLATGYPQERLHFVAGPVEETIPGTLPESIALLRLDTDWYESTRHELLHMYPLIEQAGVLMIDDYGHWEGARRAVDEYFAAVAEPVLLSRIDYTGRMAIKV